MDYRRQGDGKHSQEAAEGVEGRSPVPFQRRELRPHRGQQGGSSGEQGEGDGGAARYDANEPCCQASLCWEEDVARGKFDPRFCGLQTW